MTCVMHKVDVLTDLSLPTCRVQLQCILGFANFYRRFVQGYSTFGFPLSALTFPKVQFTWSPAADRAFRHLKHSFTTAPILFHRCNSLQPRTDSGEAKVESRASSETRPNQVTLLLDTTPA